jgi:multisubunit Na+/H+ antiporter MnhC subunit
MFTKTSNLDYNKSMIWMRKGLVHVLSLFLFVALLGGALVSSADLNLRQPARIESWLNQSQLYNHFVSEVITQAQKSTSGDDQDGQSGTSQSGTNQNDQSGTVSLSDSVVQQAAKSAFPPALVQQDVNTFLDSNYAWLQGKTSSPNFVINLTAAKQSFAQQVGQYVQVYTASLPVCTPAQLIADQGVDPLAASCRPATLTPEIAGTAATQQLAGSSNFLSNPVITASSINPQANGAGNSSANTTNTTNETDTKGTPQNQPYYQKLSRLPGLYRLATKLPLLLGGAAILSTLGIIFIAPRKRKGLRRVGLVLLETGIILVLIKLAADFAFHRLESRIFNNSNIGQLQQSLTTFAQRVEAALVKTDLLFGIAFLVLAIIIFGVLYRTRQTATTSAGSPSAKDALKRPDGALGALPPLPPDATRSKAPIKAGAGIGTTPPQAATRPSIKFFQGKRKPTASISPSPAEAGTASQTLPSALPRLKKKPPTPRPPRLIQ